jgi:Raf kinase inhibitor-like YbhB/YbcL family protein
MRILSFLSTVMVCATLLLAASGAQAITLQSHDLISGHVFARAQMYPRCGGSNLAPQLSWAQIPDGAKSLVLTMIDVDVQPSKWSHWVVINIPPAAASLAPSQMLPAGSLGLRSNFGDKVYAGPCSPAGTGTHHYEITIWALRAAVFIATDDEPASALLARLEASALARASIVGTASSDSR